MGNTVSWWPLCRWFYQKLGGHSQTPNSESPCLGLSEGHRSSGRIRGAYICIVKGKKSWSFSSARGRHTCTHIHAGINTEDHTYIHIFYFLRRTQQSAKFAAQKKITLFLPRDDFTLYIMKLQLQEPPNSFFLYPRRSQNKAFQEHMLSLHKEPPPHQTT